MRIKNDKVSISHYRFNSLHRVIVAKGLNMDEESEESGRHIIPD